MRRRESCLRGEDYAAAIGSLIRQHFFLNDVPMLATKEIRRPPCDPDQLMVTLRHDLGVNPTRCTNTRVKWL
jgi:hypothetical protein